MVKIILDAGVKVDIEETYDTHTRIMDTLGVTGSPLTLASMTGQADIAQILLDHGAKTDDPRRTEFLFIRGQVDVVRILTAREQDINRRYGHFKRTPLFYALATLKIPYWWSGGKANAEAARLLLDAGAEISTEDLAFMPLALRAKYIDR